MGIEALQSRIGSLDVFTPGAYYNALAPRFVDSLLSIARAQSRDFRYHRTLALEIFDTTVCITNTDWMKREVQATGAGGEGAFRGTQACHTMNVKPFRAIQQVGDFRGALGIPEVSWRRSEEGGGKRGQKRVISVEGDGGVFQIPGNNMDGVAVSS